MYFVKTPCRECGGGELGFFRAADGAIVLVCDRCDAIHADPAEVAHRDPGAHRADPPALEGGEWADRHQIEAAGWAHLIFGEAYPTDSRR